MTRPRPDTDILVLGAGLAGLSLGEACVRAGAGARLALIEPRETYQDDRSWCFWPAPGDPDQGLAEALWPRWRFSTADGRACTQGSQARPYAYLRGSKVYKSALDAVRGSNHVALHTGVSAGAITPEAEAVAVETSAGVLRARHVIDARPPAPDQASAATLLQVFAGREVETETAGFDPGEAELMTDMRCDAHGFVFSYVLPVSPTRALVEATRFCGPEVSRAVLERDLDGLIARRGLSGARVLRTEAGRLPMGLPEPRESGDPRILRAGAGGGGLRAASGYGFKRIRAWARSCARSVATGAGPISHPAEPRARLAMDALFLQVIAREPERAPEIFMALAERLGPERFVRFMSDEAGPADLAAVIASLPPAPFLKALAAPGGSAAA